MKSKLIVAAFLLVVNGAAQAHPGRLDANGGHWDHKNNVYLCHQAGCVPPTCDGNRGSHICGNRYYCQGNYAPGGPYYRADRCVR